MLNSPTRNNTNREFQPHQATIPVPDVSVGIVNYNSAGYLPDCLSSLFEQSPSLILETIVIDNSSQSVPCTDVLKLFPGVKRIATPCNLGTARAKNLAIRQSSGRYILLLDPDTLVRDRSIERMVAFMERHPEAGAVGCRLFSADETYQRSAFPWPTIIGAVHEYSGLFERLPFLAKWLGYPYIDPPATTRTVGYCTGACLLVSRACIESVGLFDERFFLYSDELDWCTAMWKAHWPVYYLHEGNVIHFEGGSQGDHAQRRMRILQGKLQYLEKWHGPRYVRLYQVVLFLLSAYGFVKISCQQVVAPQRARIEAETKAFYWSVLGSALHIRQRCPPQKGSC